MTHRLNTEELPEAVQKDISKLDKTTNTQNAQLQDLKTKSIQQANLFFIFQGIILLSLTSPTSSSLNCHHWWIPFILSLLSAAFNVFSFYSTINHFLARSEEVDQLLEDRNVMRVYNMTRAQVSLAKPGSEITIEEVASSSRNGEDKNEVTRLAVRTMPNPVRIWKRRVLAYLGLAVLVGFSGVVLCACRDTLCRRSANSNCVKLC